MSKSKTFGHAGLVGAFFVLSLYYVVGTIARMVRSARG
jgi:hypothetical protein